MQYAPSPTVEQLAELASEMSPGSTVRVARRIEGGLGCTTDLLEHAEAGGAPRKVILRRYGDWYADDRNRNVTQRETTALRIAAAGRIPVPEVLWQDRSGIFREQAIVISYIDGVPDLRPADTESWADQIADALAMIHQCPLDAAGPDWRSRLVDLRALNEKRLLEQEPGEKFTGHPLGVPLWERMQDLIRADLALPVADRVFLHADFWPGNMLWNGGKLVGVIDWEDSSFGDPAADVMYCANDMRYAGLPDAADRFIARYRAITGRALESAPLWTVMALTRPMPDIGRWFPSWPAMGVTDLTIDELRSRYYALVEQALDETG